MKIVCPNCHAAYAVELPDLDETGVDVKCAKCLHVFLVRKETETSELPKIETGAPPESAPPPESTEEPLLKDEDLDALMDDLIQKEIAQEPETQTEVEAESQTAPPADADLDDMIDNLLTETGPEETVEEKAVVEPEAQESELTAPPLEEKNENATEQPEFPVEEPTEPLEDDALDQMWEKAVEEGAQEPETAPPPEKAQVTPDSEPTAKSDAEPSPEENPVPEEETKPKSAAQPATSEAPTEPETSSETADEAEMSEEDLWAQAFADQEAAEALQNLKEEETEEEPAPQPAAAETPQESATVSEPPAPAPEAEESEEDVWAQAFKDQEEQEASQNQDAQEEEPVTTEASAPETDEEEDEEKEEKKKVTPIVIGGKDDEAESPGGDEEEYPDAVGDITQQKFDDTAYAEFDDDDDEFAFKPRKRKLGPFVIPRGRKGNIIIAGVMLGLLLLIGSAYFGFQTFFPDELQNLKTAENEIPEELTPREVQESDQTSSGDQVSPVPESDAPVESKLPASETGEHAGAPAQNEADRLVSELEKSRILGQVEKSEEDATTRDERLAQALAPSSKLVTLSTIMPVAYNPTDIRVLSFSMEMELSDPATAQMVRDALPVYEKIMISTVEEFLNRKFYNDVLYVKEKLQKRLLLAMNKSIKGGKVKKTKFTDFAIQ